MLSWRQMCMGQVSNVLGWYEVCVCVGGVGIGVS